MDDYFSNTRSNDELTLREAWDNFTKGLISKEQWAETLEGVKRLRQNVPAVAETWARGTIAPIFGGTGDINELGDTTRNKLIDMLPANVGKFAKNLDAAQRLFTPAALTRHLPTTKEVLASTPRVTPKHEGAETMEDVAGFVSPGTLGLANEIGGLTSKGVNRLGDYAVQKITGNPTATTTDVIDYASKFAPNKIFMGENSKLFNKDALNSAERLESQGKDAEEIFKMTGTFRGLDGKWRQEISDAASRLKGNIVGDNVKFRDVFSSSTEPNKSPWIPYKKLGNVLEHEKLYEAYPHLKDVKVQLMKPDAPLTSRGSYDPKEGIIKINQNLSPDEARSTILHEIMHDIQSKEKFALGGSHSSYQDQALAVAARDAYNIRQHWNSLPADMPNWEKTHTINKYLKDNNINVHPQAWQFATSTDTIPDRKLTDMVKLYGLDEKPMPNTPDIMYKNIAGEAEARLVQKRRNMVQEGLDYFYPMKESDFRPTLDINPKQALVHGVTPGEIKKGGEVVRRPGDYPEPQPIDIYEHNVYHGSPHEFEKFDKSKIGTGEGAQAYGYGMYFAEARPVAEEYKDFLGKKITVGGTPIYEANKRIGKTGDSLVDDMIVANLGDIDKAIKMAKEGYQDIISKNPTGGKDFYDAWKKLENYKKLDEISVVSKGNLYKADIPDEHIPYMLDWDKPLSQQSKPVLDNLKKLNDPYINQAISTQPKLSKDGEYWTYMGNTYATKSEALEDASVHKIVMGYTNLGKNPQEVSESLNKAGIKGIRYLDQGSRNVDMPDIAFYEQGVQKMKDIFNANPTEANKFALDDAIQKLKSVKRGMKDITSNFVVFNPETVKILERNDKKLNLNTSDYFERKQK